MAERAEGVLGVFAELDAAVEAVDRLRSAGLKRITAFSPMPSHDLEHALHAHESSVRLFTLVGGLTGAATGFALPTWTSLDWPLVTGGKPIISIPPMLIIAFELTILFGALSTVAGLFINARLPRARARVVYDPDFSQGHFGIYVSANGRVDEARRLLQSAGAVSVRDRAEEVRRDI
jgi:ActD protein